MTFNGIRATPLMAFNGSAVLRLLNGQVGFLLLNVIQRAKRAHAIRCHPMPFLLAHILANKQQMGIVFDTHLLFMRGWVYLPNPI